MHLPFSCWGFHRIVTGALIFLVFSSLILSSLVVGLLMFHFHDEFESLPFFSSSDTELHCFVDLSIELEEEQQQNGNVADLCDVFAHKLLRDAHHEMSST